MKHEVDDVIYPMKAERTVFIAFPYNGPQPYLSFVHFDEHFRPKVELVREDLKEPFAGGVFAWVMYEFNTVEEKRAYLDELPTEILDLTRERSQSFYDAWTKLPWSKSQLWFEKKASNTK